MACAERPNDKQNMIQMIRVTQVIHISHAHPELRFLGVTRCVHFLAEGLMGGPCLGGLHLGPTKLLEAEIPIHIVRTPAPLHRTGAWVQKALHACHILGN